MVGTGLVLCCSVSLQPCMWINHGYNHSNVTVGRGRHRHHYHAVYCIHGNCLVSGSIHKSDLNRGHGASYFSSFCWFWGCCPRHLLAFKIEQLLVILKAFLFINHFPWGSGVWSTCSHVSFPLQAEHSFRCNRSKTLPGAVVQKTYLNIGIYRHILHCLESSKVLVKIVTRSFWDDIFSTLLPGY